MNMNDQLYSAAPGFITELNVSLKGECVWRLDDVLIYQSDILGWIEVPVGFETDLASVPRVPIVWEAWGARCHRESVVHDYLYRFDSWPQATKDEADRVFLEAMKSRGVKWWIRQGMYSGVKWFGGRAFHCTSVRAELWK